MGRIVPWYRPLRKGSHSGNKKTKIPFDLNQYRTIPIETRNAYTLYPKLQTYTAQVANQVRRAGRFGIWGQSNIALLPQR
ncbi:MAG: hypothetical protein JO210_11150 [Acidobacteriaceae bacterium]|nr:hypothetical protein [Acidobacteriaceae bacterium]